MGSADPQLVVMLRADPVQRARLLREHAPDATGRCPKCRAGADSSGFQMAPCRLLVAAEAATSTTHNDERLS